MKKNMVRLIQISLDLRAWHELETRIVKFHTLGLRRCPWETLSAWLSRIERTVEPIVSLDIPRKSLRLHYRYRDYVIFKDYPP
jgi:hypothetical protein